MFWTKEPPLLATGSTRSRPRATLKFHGNRKERIAWDRQSLSVPSDALLPRVISIPRQRIEGITGQKELRMFDLIPNLAAPDIYPCWFANWRKKSCKKTTDHRNPVLTQISFKFPSAILRKPHLAQVSSSSSTPGIVEISKHPRFVQ